MCSYQDRLHQHLGMTSQPAIAVAISFDSGNVNTVNAHSQQAATLDLQMFWLLKERWWLHGDSQDRPACTGKSGTCSSLWQPAANTPFLPLCICLLQKEGSQRKKRKRPKEEFGLTFHCSCGRDEHLTVFLTGSLSDFRHEIRQECGPCPKLIWSFL